MRAEGLALTFQGGLHLGDDGVHQGFLREKLTVGKGSESPRRQHLAEVFDLLDPVDPIEEQLVAADPAIHPAPPERCDNPVRIKLSSSSDLRTFNWKIRTITS